MGRLAAPHRDIAARRRATQEQRSGNDAIGDDLVLDAFEVAHAFDEDRVRAVPGELRSHGDEEVREVDDLGLHRRVRDRRLAVGQDGGEHRVLGGADAWAAQLDASADEPPFRFRDEEAVFVGDLRSEPPEGQLVEIRRARAEDAPPRQRNLGPAKASEQRTDDIEAGRELADERIGRPLGRDA